MTSSDEAITGQRKGIIGSPSNFWLYSTSTGFDLTHPPTPKSPPNHPRITFPTTTVPITISPSRSALVIIDMQNFFLSALLGRPQDSNGIKAQENLLQHAIPAARKAGIRIIWLNWGLTPEDITVMPPATIRAFGFETIAAEQPYDLETWYEKAASASASKHAAVDSHGVNEGAHELARTSRAHTTIEAGHKNPRIYRGLGAEVGPIVMEDGSTESGGGLLMRDSWNADLTPPLRAAYDEGLKREPLDVWVHKNRMSGLWGEKTPCTEFLEKESIKTLFFAGVNTDQCVGGSLQDAFTKGYDCVLLSDGCGTTSPHHAKACVEFNAEKTWGFLMTCEMFQKGVEGMGKQVSGAS